MRKQILGVAVAALGLAGTASATVTFSAAGATPGDIAAEVDAFRAALGSNNGVGGSFSGGRREINWDGVPDSFASPNQLPGNFFNSVSPRGLSMTTPGSELRVSADSSNPTATATRFADIDPIIAGNFTPFSEQRLFAPLGSHIVDVTFFVPGTAIPATVLGFGVVFTDVEVAQTTYFQLYNAEGNEVGGVVSPVTGNGGLSFIGMIRDVPEIARVRIFSGETAIDSGRPSLDYVAMDDFIYGEPVPTPGAVGLLALAGVMVVRRRRG
jgi:MYXO-CTERM domain-containing protein